MRKLLLFISAMFVWMGVFSQGTLPYNDNFESYTVGGFMAVQNTTWWTTWSNLPGSGEDGSISNAFANSPTKSVLVENSTDLILKLGNKTAGKYELNWKMYVETGKGGYYNIQHFQSPGTEYAFEVYFLAAGGGQLLAGSATPFTFTYPKNTWFEVKHLIDLDADLIKLYVNGVLVHQWPFSYQAGTTTGTKQLGGVDFYAGAVTGETPKYFFDDVTYQVMPTVLYQTGFDSFTLNSFVAVSDPTWFTTWSNLPGSGEDAIVKNDFAHSAPHSAQVMTATDLILKLGNKITGKYDLNWWMYIETGKGGYYNIQHFQSPGNEYAFEVYFLAAGGGQLLAGSATPFTFTYPKNTWFEVKHSIDLDADLIKLYINGALVHQWPFSYQAGTTTGTKQLGGVDFYAGAVTGETPKYYFDDVYYAQVGAPTDPVIGVTPASLSSSLQSGLTEVKQITVANTGPTNLTFNANIILNSDAPGINTLPVTAYPVKTSSTLNLCSAAPSVQPSSVMPETDATAILNYDGVNFGAIGWNSPPITVTVAARFPNNMTLPYAGMFLESVTVYINQLNTSGSNLMTVKVFGQGTAYEPGVLLSSQTFTPAGAAWETIMLTTPVLVTGQDLWIGYTFTQLDPATYIPGTDAGPNNPNGDFLSTGVGWSHLSNNPALTRNWNIRGNLNGNPFPQWLSVAPASGTVAPAGTQVLNVTFNTANLAAGTYQGIVRVLSNDPITPLVDVPATLTVIAALCPAPTALTVGSITTTSASIGWTGPPVVALDYGPVGHAAGSGTYISPIVTNPYTLSSLSPGTAYDVYLRQECGPNNNSTWSGPLNFSTLPRLSITPSPFNFGLVSLGLQSSPQLFTIKNNTTSSIILESVGLSGGDFGQFTLTDGTIYPYSLGAGVSYTVSVVFIPASSGLKTTNLAVTELEQGPILTTLTGTGICPAPTTLTATSITTTSATLGWTANGTTAWEIEWGLFGFVHNTGTMITTGVTNPHLLSGLSPSTVYSYYVRGKCGSADFSTWTGPYSFATLCVPFNLPYSQNFDALPAPNLPVCWSRYSSPALRPWVTSSNTSIGAHSSPNFAGVFYSGTEAKNEWLVSPAILVTPGIAHQVKFWVKAPGYAGTPEKLKLVMSTDPSLSALTTAPVLWDGNNLQLSAYTEFVIPFTPGTTGPYYFAWHAYSDADIDYIAMDDITIEVAPVPVNLAVSGGVGAGQSYCYNASGTITVTNFTVPSTASAKFIANTNILFKPGTIVVSGGYMLGMISSTYCNTGPLAPAVATGEEEAPASLEHTYFSLYPNPTNGNFTLVQKGNAQYGNVKVEIYGMRGDKVLSSQMIGEKQHEFVTSDLPNGIYFVKVVAENYTETIKLIKTR